MKCNLISFAVIALGLAACTQSDFQLETPEASVTEISKESVEPGSTKVSMSLAEKVALSTRPGTRAGTNIQDIRTVFTDDGEPAFHAVNFANSNGFVLVSASQNYTPILAKVESGSFDLTNIPPNMRYYLEGYKYAVKACNAAPEDSVKNYRRQWKQYLNDETSVQKPVTRSSDPLLDAFIFDSQMQWNNQGYDWTSLAVDRLGLNFFEDMVIELEDHFPEADPATCFIVSLPTVDTVYVNTLVTTKWGQGKPYNAEIDPSTVGCGPLAVAQIMKYHKKPAMFNWDAMANFYYQTQSAPEVASLLKSVGEKCGIDYRTNKTGKTTIEKCASTLREYGYSDAKVISHNYLTVQNNIVKKQPVIGGGEDLNSDAKHAWIYDGIDCIEHTFYYYLLIPEKDPTSTSYFKYKWNQIDLEKGIVEYYVPKRLFHIKWGYYGNRDEWYADYNLSFTDDNGITYFYSKNRRDIVDIK